MDELIISASSDLTALVVFCGTLNLNRLSPLPILIVKDVDPT